MARRGHLGVAFLLFRLLVQALLAVAPTVIAVDNSTADRARLDTRPDVGTAVSDINGSLIPSNKAAAASAAGNQQPTPAPAQPVAPPPVLPELQLVQPVGVYPSADTSNAVAAPASSSPAAEALGQPAAGAPAAQPTSVVGTGSSDVQQMLAASLGAGPASNVGGAFHLQCTCSQPAEVGAAAAGATLAPAKLSCECTLPADAYSRVTGMRAAPLPM